MGNLKIAFVVFLCFLASIHAGKGPKGPKPGVLDGNTGEIQADVHGIVDVILPEGGLPEPHLRWFFGVHITADNGEQFVTHVPWSEKTCPKNKCNYNVQNVRGKTYTVAVNHYDTFADSLKDLKKLEGTGTLKVGNNNKLNIKYDIPEKSASMEQDGTTPSIWSGTTSETSSGTSSSSSSVSSSSGSGQKVYLNVHGEVEVISDPALTGHWWIGVHLTLDDEQDGYYDTSVVWSPTNCKNNKCKYNVQDVHGKVGQSYSVEVNHYDKTSDSRKNTVKAINQKGVLKAKDNKLDITYNVSQKSVTLVGVSSDSSSTSSSSSSSSTSAVITVEGSLDVDPPHGPKPNAVMINLVLDGDTKTKYSALANWPSDCLGNKCEYVIKNIPAVVGHKYKIRVSVIYITNGKDTVILRTEKTATSKQMTIGGSKVNLKYDSNNSKVTQEN